MNKLNLIIKRFDSPDNVSYFEKGKFETVTINNTVLGKATYEPGWKWSEHVGPKINKDFCDVEHLGMVISGSATAVSAGGEVTIFVPGDIFYVPQEEHDSWVVGDEPYISLHFLGAEKYTK